MKDLILFILFLGFLLLWIAQQFKTNSFRNCSFGKVFFRKGDITSLSICHHFFLGLSPILGFLLNKLYSLSAGNNFQYYSLKNNVEFKNIEESLNFRIYSPFTYFQFRNNLLKSLFNLFLQYHSKLN